MAHSSQKLKVKLINKYAILPKKGSKEAAGFDLFSTTNKTLAPMERYCFKIGITVDIPEGYYGRIAPRSGLASRIGLHVLGGVIDSDFYGEIGVILINFGNMPYKIERGHRIAQLIIEKILPCHSEDTSTGKTRGKKGFGSTGQ